MLSFLRKKIQIKTVIAVLVVVVLAVASVLYFSSQGSQEMGEMFLPAIRNINIDYSLFKNLQYQALRTYGVWPLDIGEVGRENPFMPY